MSDFMKTRKLGDITVPVGTYQSGGEKKTRQRQVGALMETEHDDGGRRMWIRINGDALSPSLLMLALRASEARGEDGVVLPIWEERAGEERGKGGARARGEVEEAYAPF